MLDRLIDPDSGGTSWRRGYSVDQMIDSVRRDLEDLLNTRQSNQGISEDFVEVQRSIIAYGLPDLTSLNAVTAQQREEIGRMLEAHVEMFEPRLKDIRARLVDPGDGKERTVKFHIEATAEPRSRARGGVRHGTGTGHRPLPNQGRRAAKIRSQGSTWATEAGSWPRIRKQD